MLDILVYQTDHVSISRKKLSDLSATVCVLEEARLKFHQKKKKKKGQLILFCEQW